MAIQVRHLIIAHIQEYIYKLYVLNPEQATALSRPAAASSSELGISARGRRIVIIIVVVVVVVCGDCCPTQVHFYDRSLNL